MLNASKTTVNEGESIVFTIDLSNAKRLDPNTPDPINPYWGTYFPYNAGDNVQLYLSSSEAGRTDFVGDQGAWSMTLGDDLIARWSVTVKSDEMTEGEEVGFFWFDEDWFQRVTIVDTSKTPASNEGPTIINNLSDHSVTNNGGIIVNGDNNGVINLFAISGTDGDDLLQGDTLSDRSDRLVGGNGNDRLLGYNGSDYLQGDGGDDFLHGMHGKDQINGGEGNDTMRGGHGHDEIGGGSGGDWIWGGIGKNTISVGANDNAKDDVYVQVDVFQNTNGNPFGVNADILQELGTEDKIFMHGEGLHDGMLSYGQVNHDGKDGVGIFVNGSIEALVVGGFSVGQVDAMTTGGFFA